MEFHGGEVTKRRREIHIEKTFCSGKLVRMLPIERRVDGKADISCLREIFNSRSYDTRYHSTEIGTWTSLRFLNDTFEFTIRRGVKNKSSAKR